MGVSGNKTEQEYLQIKIDGDYPMPQIPMSEVDHKIDEALALFTAEERRSLGTNDPIIVRGSPAARNSQPYRDRRACAGNTNCIPICPIQAKYDPTITLNEALETGFVELIHSAVANEIIIDGNGRVSQVNYLRYGNNSRGKVDDGIVQAKVFIIAANAIETPRLLLMSKNSGRTPNGVANRSDLVGRNLMDHPYYVAWGLMPPNKPNKRVYPYRGPLITSGIEELRDGAFSPSAVRSAWTSATRAGISSPAAGAAIPIGRPWTLSTARIRATSMQRHSARDFSAGSLPPD